MQIQSKKYNIAFLMNETKLVNRNFKIKKQSAKKAL
jgi:hypothetical protein